jgi:hypothetical protein
VLLPLIALTVGLWYVSGQLDMFEFGKWATAVVGGLTALGALLWSAANVVRQLLLTSPLSVSAATRTSDPMRDLQRRYSYLIRSTGTPVLIVIENLDRCRASYVVELLEGLQTALKNPSAAMEPTRPVAFVVPGSSRWITDSYREVYKEFEHTTQEPGRPFGLAFFDKVFDFALQLPVIPARVSTRHVDDVHIEDVRQRINRAETEQEIRVLVGEAERREHIGGDAPVPPLPELRVRAVERMGVLEANSKHRSCKDTESQLTALLNDVGAPAIVARQLLTAYCVQRTSQLLGGHEMDAADDAIPQLGLWTILRMRWPLLAEHLESRSDDISWLRDGKPPPGASHELEPLFRSAELAQFLFACDETTLTPDHIRRFSMPIRLRPKDGAPVRLETGPPQPVLVTRSARTATP